MKPNDTAIRLMAISIILMKSPTREFYHYLLLRYHNFGKSSYLPTSNYIIKYLAKNGNR